MTSHLYEHASAFTLPPLQNIQNDAASSAHAIQGALFKKYGHRFLVNCKARNDADVTVNLAAHGDGFCSVANANVWCQAVALAA